MDIDQILVASLGRGADSSFDFVGHMQNFYVNDHRFFEYLSVPRNLWFIKNGRNTYRLEVKMKKNNHRGDGMFTYVTHVNQQVWTTWN